MPFEEHEEHRAEVDRSLQMFLARMTVLDPTLGDTSLKSLWIEAITEDL